MMLSKEDQEFLRRLNAETDARLKAKGVDLEKVRREYSREDKFTTKKGDFKIIDPETGRVIFE
ncbi:hypothetical protein [Siminovitchia thermophila]|nr:hypothetical protein [Siminovitchia thermophila]